MRIQSGGSQHRCGLRTDQDVKIRETRTMVPQQFCRKKHAAKSETRSGASFVGSEASVKTLMSYHGIEHPCGFRGDGRLKIRATGEVVSQQKFAR
jgi:hypothetical protein